jgi:hypothetical protein
MLGLRDLCCEVSFFFIFFQNLQIDVQIASYGGSTLLNFSFSQLVDFCTRGWRGVPISKPLFVFSNGW